MGRPGPTPECLKREAVEWLLNEGCSPSGSEQEDREGRSGGVGRTLVVISIAGPKIWLAVVAAGDDHGG